VVGTVPCSADSGAVCWVPCRSVLCSFLGGISFCISWSELGTCTCSAVCFCSAVLPFCFCSACSGVVHYHLMPLPAPRYHSISAIRYLFYLHYRAHFVTVTCLHLVPFSLLRLHRRTVPVPPVRACIAVLPFTFPAGWSLHGAQTLHGTGGWVGASQQVGALGGWVPGGATGGWG